MQAQIDKFISALNAEYTKRGLNGVAYAEHMGNVQWMIVSEIQSAFDTHKEYHLVEYNTREHRMEFIKWIRS